MNVMDLHEHLLRLARDRAEEERAMTMTPDKLREKGNRWRELGQYDLADIYNQHAAALEEVGRLKAAWNALDSALRERDKQVIAIKRHADIVVADADDLQRYMSHLARLRDQERHPEIAEALVRVRTSVAAYRAEFMGG